LVQVAVRQQSDAYAHEVDAAEAKRGWYADPFDRYRYRFWDGERWTGYAANTSVEWDDAEPANAAVAEAEVVPPLRGVLSAFIGYFTGIALAFAITAALIGMHRPGGRITQLLASEIGLWTGLVGACVIVSRRRGTGSLRRDFGWRFRWIDIGFGIAGAIAGRMVASFVVLPFPMPFRHPQAPDRGVLQRVANHPFDWAVLAFVICIGAPLIEELFFRGLMQPRLVEMFGTARGLPATALLFGAAHMTAWQGWSITLVYATSIAGAGLVLGMMRHVTGRLGPSTWAHFFFNAQAFVVIALVSRA
jgi:membrane protease YdiL (CAAX protease family)